MNCIDDDCLNCPLPRCKYDKAPKKPKVKKVVKDAQELKREYNRKYYRAHKDKIQASQRKYRDKNRKRINELQLKYYYEKKRRWASGES